MGADDGNGEGAGDRAVCDSGIIFQQVLVGEGSVVGVSVSVDPTPPEHVARTKTKVLTAQEGIERVNVSRSTTYSDFSDYSDSENPATGTINDE